MLVPLVPNLGPLLLAALAQLEPSPNGYVPPIAADDGECAKQFEVLRRQPRFASGEFQVELVASEPLVANVVALDVDPRGRCYVAETFRLNGSVLDDRSHLDWLEDDLACRTVADRLEMIRRHAGEKFADFSKDHEQLRLLESRGTAGHSGRFDRSTVVAQFDDATEGVAAGVLVHGRDVYFADIPSLWRLRDLDGDGVPDRRELLATGFGVHFNFTGHDLHGLRIGPDGRLYFSIGDRGLDVVTKEGRHLVLPDCGAVLRCELDGSELELFHTGLRNPQELAFDDAGDLFTCDNNSDAGDSARLVHVVDGADSGWRVGYQWVERPVARGPWNAEKLWRPREPGQPAYVFPPVADFVRGPSGLAHEPGTCFGPKWRDHFFVCDFEGETGNTKIVSFTTRRVGASHEIADADDFLDHGIVATDVEFAPDGGMYVSDWVHGWTVTGRGRVWRISDPALRASPLAANTHQLLSEGFEARSSAELEQLLDHPDQRVRQEAQFALAERGDVDALATVARFGGSPRARVHAAWALGQVARAKGSTPERAAAAIATLITLTNGRGRDRQADDGERCAQAARALGDAAPRLTSDDAESHAARDTLRPAVLAALERLVDGSSGTEPRARFFAALSLSRFHDRGAVAPLVAMVEQNDDADVALRHAGVVGLERCASGPDLVELASHRSSAVRLAALLAMRRRAMPAIERFLHDPERALVVEAALAIHDAPIDAALEPLAALVELPEAKELPLPLLVRCVDANFRLGRPAHAKRLAAVAASRLDLPESVRLDAMQALAQFDAPPRRDRVLGLFRPIAGAREPAAVAALTNWLDPLLTRDVDAMRELAAKFVRERLVAGFDGRLAALAEDEERATGARVAAIEALAALKSASQRAVVERVLPSIDEKVRSAARDVLAKFDPALALEILRKVLDQGGVVEKQDAFATLAKMSESDARATQLLASWLDRLVAGKVGAELALDLLQAGEKCKADAAIAPLLEKFEAARLASDPLAKWRECQEGGDAARGRRLFFERTEFQCVKCHKVGADGAAEIGPNLAGVAARNGRDYLLESIVTPNQQIAQGYRNTIFVTNDGDVVDGRVVGEDARDWLVATSGEGTVLVAKSNVKSSREGKSAMPTDLVERMSKRELRDLVAWLASLK
jgi:quinoprotein glucose dehydrogenase